MNDQLDDDRLARARKALLGPGGAALIDFIVRVDLGRPRTSADTEPARTAVELGWIEPSANRLTAVGRLVADPLREYSFWRERGRTVHGENHDEQLRCEAYRGLDVLEPGSGFGCNLFTLSTVANRVVGLEPVGVYRQFTEILAALEGLDPSEVVGGSAEKMPFPDASFDIVLCYSAHQYMDIRPALREMARVLRPGGQLQIIGGTLDVYRQEHGRGLRVLPLGRLRAYWLTVINTLAYERLGRRVLTPKGLTRTTAPVYPMPRYLDRWIEDAGLRVRADARCRIANETLTVADKPR